MVKKYLLFLSIILFSTLIIDGKPSGKILHLGKYNGDFEWADESDRTNPNLMYHTQFYVNGTDCEVTGNMRKTDVKVINYQLSN